MSAKPDVLGDGFLQQLKSHPPGLKYLFGAEAWERFSYYGMRALLVLYMTKHLNFNDEDALKIYGLYTSAVYITPLVGGYLADAYLGARRAILIGGIIMSLGHFAMAFESLLYPALTLIVIGNGFFKPNISTLVGSLYKENDPRRDGGFTLFYMGINLGAFFSPLVCGFLGETVGWHWGFASAGVGMLFGLMFFMGGQHHLGDAGLKPKPPAPGQRHEPLTREDWQRLVVVTTLSGFSLFFWAAFEQAGGTMTLFADSQTRRELLGFTIPASFFQSINPVFILLFAPAFSIFWQRLDSSKYRLSSGGKFGWGLILVGLGFVIMGTAEDLFQLDKQQVSAMWLISAYLVHTVAELCISPVGLSTTTKLSHPRTVGLMMGVWFGCSAVGNFFAGFLHSMLEETNWELYWFLVATSVGSGVVLLLLSPLLNKWSHGRDQ